MFRLAVVQERLRATPTSVAPVAAALAACAATVLDDDSETNAVGAVTLVVESLAPFRDGPYSVVAERVVATLEGLPVVGASGVNEFGVLLSACAVLARTG